MRPLACKSWVSIQHCLIICTKFQSQIVCVVALNGSFLQYVLFQNLGICWHNKCLTLTYLFFFVMYQRKKMFVQIRLSNKHSQWIMKGASGWAAEAKRQCWQLWDLNPRPFGPEPKSGALDHSAKLSLLCLLWTYYKCYNILLSSLSWHFKYVMGPMWSGAH